MTVYDPPDRGFEREIRKRIDYWARLTRERGGDWSHPAAAVAD